MYMKLRNTLAGCMLALLCLLPATGGHAQTAAPQGRPAIARDAAIEKAVAERLGQMTLDEKLGQMIQIEINLIAYNPTSDKFKRPTDKVIEQFLHKAESICRNVTLRRERGGGKKAACGQLRLGKIQNDGNLS